MTISLKDFIVWIAQILGLNRKQVFAGANETGGATTVLQPAYTLRLRPGQDDPDRDKPAAADLENGGFRLAWHGLTDIGAVRNHNEDAFAVAEADGKKLFAVADGMGGHDAGEVASALAIEALAGEISAQSAQTEDPKSLLERAVHHANAVVKKEGDCRGSDMGTTLSAVLVAGDTAYVANVGDSRVYWIERDSITQITEDHSLVARLVRTGKLTRDEARGHPRSNLLYRTVGNEEGVMVDTFHVQLRKAGCLLLCTDGLWGEVTDREIHDIAVAERDPAKVCGKLVSLANAKGGKDNITAVVVKIHKMKERGENE